MPFAVFVSLFSVVLISWACWWSERENTLEILVLPQQLRILQRTQARTPRLSWWRNCR